MNQEERKQKIDAILGEVKKKAEYPGISPELWITAEQGKPGEPEFRPSLALQPKAIYAAFLHAALPDCSAFVSFRSK